MINTLKNHLSEAIAIIADLTNPEHAIPLNTQQRIDTFIKEVNEDINSIEEILKMNAEDDLTTYRLMTVVEARAYQDKQWFDEEAIYSVIKGIAGYFVPINRL